VDVNVIVARKVDHIRLVCHAVNAILNVSQTVAKVILQMKTFKAGESNDDGDWCCPTILHAQRRPEKSRRTWAGVMGFWSTNKTGLIGVSTMLESEIGLGLVDVIGTIWLVSVSTTGMVLMSTSAMRTGVVGVMELGFTNGTGTESMFKLRSTVGFVILQFFHIK
jgi:hypothetical protein